MLVGHIHKYCCKDPDSYKLEAYDEICDPRMFFLECKGPFLQVFEDASR